MLRYTAFMLCIASALVLGTLSTTVHSQVGECLDPVGESNADCDGVGNCGGLTGGCDAQGGGVWYKGTNIKQAGTCQNGWWDSGCIQCTTYTCAAVDIYDAGTCSIANYVGNGLLQCSDCCVPQS